MSGGPDGGSVLEQCGGPGEWLVRSGAHWQSAVDLADPTRLVFDYVRRIADVLDALAPASEPVRALHVGGAGMTLPRYLAATRPGSRQAVLEPDVDLTAEVRRRLPLPSGSRISVRPVDGATGLRAEADGRWQVVVVDAFTAAGDVPEDLLEPTTAADLARVLAPGGWCLLNLTERAPFRRARRAYASLAEAFGSVCAAAETVTWRGRGPGNLLLVAGPDERPVRWLTERARGRGVPYEARDARRTRDSLGGATT